MLTKTIFCNAVRKLPLVSNSLSAKGSSCRRGFHVPLQLSCCRLLPNPTWSRRYEEGKELLSMAVTGGGLGWGRNCEERCETAVCACVRTVPAAAALCVAWSRKGSFQGKERLWKVLLEVCKHNLSPSVLAWPSCEVVVWYQAAREGNGFNPFQREERRTFSRETNADVTVTKANT